AMLASTAILATLTTLTACSDSSSESVAPGSSDASEAGADTEEPIEDGAPPACTAPVDKGPWVVAVDETTAKVRWESCVPGVSGLSFLPEEAGGAPTKVASTVTETHVATTIQAPLISDADFAGTYWMHEVALTGLTAATCYEYVVDADTAAKGRFCTARRPGDAFDFIAFGDTNPGLGITPAMVTTAYAQKPDFTVHAGDVQYYASGLETYASWMRAMQPMLRTGAFFPAVGNHEDERDDEKRDYFDRFWGGAGFDGTNDYYRFHSGGVWFFVLDTELDVSPSSLQGSWLQSQLLDAQGKPGFRFSIVYFHKPWVTCGDKSSDPATRALYTPIFEKTGVTMVIQAHMHGYERFELGTLTYLTAGGGGGALGRVDENKARPECVDRKASGNFFNTVFFHVSPGELKGTVTDDHGAVRDTFTKVVP
ncbi:MAG: metallophosphoesterase, partial [Polyangiales bacterium]